MTLLPPHLPEIGVMSFVLELPADLRLPPGSGVMAIEASDGRFDGWPTGALVAVTGAADFSMPDGFQPATRLMFRRAVVRTQLPLQAADLAFGPWVSPLLSPGTRWRRRLSYRVHSVRGFRRVATVVALTRYVPAIAMPQSTGDEVDWLIAREAWLDAEFNAALQDLNDFLVSLGLSAGSLKIGPIAPADIPAQVPVILESTQRDHGKPVGATWLHDVHLQYPDISLQEMDEAELQVASRLFLAHQLGDEPFFDAYELWCRAHVDNVAGRYQQAVLALATAIEILVSSVIREVMRRRGSSETRIAGILSTSLKNVVRDHLGSALRQRIGNEDFTDRGHPIGWWWCEGYGLRP